MNQFRRFIQDFDSELGLGAAIGLLIGASALGFRAYDQRLQEKIDQMYRQNPVTIEAQVVSPEGVIRSNGTNYFLGRWQCDGSEILDAANRTGEPVTMQGEFDKNRFTATYIKYGDLESGRIN